MGIHTSLVKKRVRNRATRLIIDFYYTNKSGERVRFVRHAELQTRDGAEREAAQYHQRAILTGDPRAGEAERDDARRVLRGDLQRRRCSRSSGRTRASVTRRSGANASSKAFGSKRLDEIDEAALRGFARSIEIEKRAGEGAGRLSCERSLREAAQLGLIDAAPRLPPGIIKDAKKLPAAPTLGGGRGPHREGERLDHAWRWCSASMPVSAAERSGRFASGTSTSTSA